MQKLVTLGSLRAIAQSHSLKFQKVDRTGMSIAKFLVIFITYTRLQGKFPPGATPGKVLSIWSVTIKPFRFILESVNLLQVTLLKN